MKVLYFGSYNPEYPRNRVLIKGLRQNGIDVIECNDRSRSIIKYFKLFFKYCILKDNFDLMIVGFPGQETMFLARFLTRKSIIFDAFTSHYGGHILDRKKYGRDSFMAKWYKLLDTYSCKLANIVLLDTDAHINFFVKEFGLNQEKFRRILAGTDIDVFYPREVKKSNNKFIVHFHGNYIPLQGINYIIRAAKILEDEEVVFNLIGRGQTYATDRRLAQELGVRNINFIDRVSYEDLAEYISGADVCLGIFGDTPKTEIVIPNKVYEALACRKPVITADTIAIHELLVNEDTAILCRRADSKDLAEKIMNLKNNPTLLNAVAENGYKKFVQVARPIVLGKELSDLIKNNV